MNEPIFRVLVVEDEEKLRDIIGNFISKSCQVDMAADGGQALKKISETTYDFVITDFRIPGPTGVEVIKAAYGKSKGTVTVLMTSELNKEMSLEAEAHGCSKFYKKPFSYLDMVEDLGLANVPARVR